MNGKDRSALENASSYEDMLDDAYEMNGQIDQEDALRTEVEKHLKEYAEQSVHEGEPMTFADFVLYLSLTFDK